MGPAHAPRAAYDPRRRSTLAAFLDRGIPLALCLRYHFAALHSRCASGLRFEAALHTCGLARSRHKGLPVPRTDVLIGPHAGDQRDLEARSQKAKSERARYRTTPGPQRLRRLEAARDLHADLSHGAAVPTVFRVDVRELVRVDAREPIGREVVEPKSRVVLRGDQERRKLMAIVIGRAVAREQDSKPRR